MALGLLATLVVLALYACGGAGEARSQAEEARASQRLVES